MMIRPTATNRCTSAGTPVVAGTPSRWGNCGEDQDCQGVDETDR